MSRADGGFVSVYRPTTCEGRQRGSPLSDAMLRPSQTGRGVVQFRGLLTDEDFSRLADWLRQYPAMTLRAYGSYDRSIHDLEFLRFFPFLRRFVAAALYDPGDSLDA